MGIGGTFRGTGGDHLVKSMDNGCPTGYDAGKKIKGREYKIAVESGGNANQAAF